MPLLQGNVSTMIKVISSSSTPLWIFKLKSFRSLGVSLFLYLGLTWVSPSLLKRLPLCSRILSLNKYIKKLLVGRENSLVVQVSSNSLLLLSWASLCTSFPYSKYLVLWGTSLRGSKELFSARAWRKRNASLWSTGTLFAYPRPWGVLVSER